VFQLVKGYLEIADEIAKTFGPFPLAQMDARDRWKVSTKLDCWLNCKHYVKTPISRQNLFYRAGVSTKFLGWGTGIKC